MQPTRGTAARAASQEVGADLRVDLGIGERLADDATRTLFLNVSQTDKRLAGAVDEGVDTLRCDIEDVGRLDRRHPEPLAQHDRLALLLGQRRKQGDGDVKLVVRLHLVGNRGAGVGMPLAELLVYAPALRHREAREALVAQDAEQPGPRLAHALTLGEHAMRRQERGLHGIFCIFEAAEAMPGKAQEFACMLPVKGSRQRALGLRASPTSQGNGDGHDSSVDAPISKI